MLRQKLKGRSASFQDHSSCQSFSLYFQICSQYLSFPQSRPNRLHSNSSSWSCAGLLFPGVAETESKSPLLQLL
jgi:hypothetical protein